MISSDLHIIRCIGTIADEKNNYVYWFVIAEYGKDAGGKDRPEIINLILRLNNIETTTPRVEYVFVDFYNVLGFYKSDLDYDSKPEPYLLFEDLKNSKLGRFGFACASLGPSHNHSFQQATAFNIITGINIIDDMLFFTNNISEPKKINVNRSIAGSQSANSGANNLDHTKLVVDGVITNQDVLEEHVTVIKKAPKYPPVLEMNDGYSDLQGNISGTFDFSFETFLKAGDTVAGIVLQSLPTATDGTFNIQLNDILIIDNYNILVPITPIEIFTIKVKVTRISTNADGDTIIDVEVLNLDENAVLGETFDGSPYSYVFSKFVDQEKAFEYKFPRFAYRYKYTDGEYSSFSPFSETAFLPGNFDYHPRKGYNLGMTNRLISLYLKEFVTEDMPLDVSSIDLLYKESDSNNVYIIETLYRGDDDFEYVNYSEDVGVGITVPNVLDIKRNGRYEVKSESIYALLPSNQLLRPFDNVPIRALSQEVTGNRIIYGNYLQNYNLLIYDKSLSYINFTAIDTFGNLSFLPANGDRYKTSLDVSLKTFSEDLEPLKPHKSIKSIREYQIGVVYLDEYGRETPVLTTNNSNVKISKQEADQSTQLVAKLNGLPPSFAKGFKFYVKETSNEYYNLAMDRFYDAEDGNIWLAFPSVDRNKVDEETFLILKKTVDSNSLVNDQARYKIIAIENEAPDYIKTQELPLGELVHNSTIAQPVTNVFGTTVVDFPTVTSNTFSLQSAAFNNTSVQNVIQEVNAKNSKIYIRFENESSQKSKDYEITALTNGVVPLSSNNIINPNISEVQFTTKENLTTDIDFIFNDANNPTSVVADIKVVFTKRQIENSPKFNGRFFVKIFNDAIVQQNIASTADTRYSVLSERKFYFLSPNHVSLHKNHPSVNVDDVTDHLIGWHESGQLSGTSTNGVYHPYDGKWPGFPFSGSGYGSNRLKDWWYTFTAFFRSRPNFDINDRGLSAGENNYEDVWYIDGHASAGTHFSEDHTNKTTFPPLGNPLMSGTTHGFIGRVNEGTHKGMGITNYANQCIMEIGFGGLEPDPSYTDGNFNNNYNRFYPPNFFNQFNNPSYGWASVAGNLGIRGQNHDGKGWTKGTHSIYSIESNSNYLGGAFDQKSFAKHLKPGMKFRWKEDPNGNVYTVMSSTDYYVLRYDVPSALKFESELPIYNMLRPENYQKNWRLTLDRPMVWNPLDPTTLTSTQDPMNGFSPNSFNANGPRQSTSGEISNQSSAIGYTLQILDPVYDDNVLSENPAIWETQPKEQVDLDVYYEASQEYPIKLNNKNAHNIIKIGSIISFPYASVRYQNFADQSEVKVISVTVDNNEDIKIDINNQFLPGFAPASNNLINITNQGRTITYTMKIVDSLSAPTSLYRNGTATLILSNNIHNSLIELNWFNCYSFANGVESNRIEDNFNKIFIDKGAVASTTVSPDDIYKLDRRKNGLIFSGIYNSTSEVNNLNQFIQAEPITKEINPTYGSIQKLFSRSTASGDLVVFCEDKVLKVLADKDALFNADGNANLTASTNVLGQAIPYVGDFGISKDPESFAKESYRAYFTDKQRGAVLRLSMDGITEISKDGMSEYFGNNLKEYISLIGSYDQDKSEYNITLYNGEITLINTPDVIDGPDVIDESNSEVVVINEVEIKNTTISYDEKVKGWVSFKSFIPELGISCSNTYYTFKKGEIYKHHVKEIDYNTFYGTYNISSVTFVFNQEPSIIKDFKTLNYEGTKSRKYDYSDSDYINFKNYKAQRGWYCSKITTDKDTGRVKFFVEKEGKWFNNIQGQRIFDRYGLSQDPSDLPKTFDTTSVQGLGFANKIEIKPGCTDPDADNYDPSAGYDDGSCTYTP